MTSHFHIFLIRAVNRLFSWFPEKISVIQRADFIEASKKYLGMKYVLGGDGKGDNGIDCSHLVCAAMIDTDGARKYFHRTAHDLHRLSQKISLEEMLPGDLIFWPDEKERMEHVAIFLSKKEDSLNIIDASGSSSGVWSTIERTIELQESLSFGRPPFFDEKIT
ncbi:C40 family peptidase [Candidatus Gracilibacteria bacterium]|nr:C40 family peptidase [Candidatus Gracilibacteria bacterium]